jgi:hypothetical protein
VLVSVCNECMLLLPSVCVVSVSYCCHPCVFQCVAVVYAVEGESLLRGVISRLLQVSGGR